MAPPLEPPSTVRPVPTAVLYAMDPPAGPGGRGHRPLLSPFMQRVAHQMQLDADLPDTSHAHRQLGHSKSAIGARTGHQAPEQGQGQALPQPPDGAAAAAYTAHVAVSHATLHLQVRSQHTQQQPDAQRGEHTQLPAQRSRTQPASPLSSPDAFLAGHPPARQHSQAASPKQYALLLSHSHDASAQQHAGDTQQGRQSWVHLTTAQDGGSQAARSSTSSSQQRHSPSSRHSAVHKPCPRHAGSVPVPTAVSSGGTSLSSQQASNSIGVHSRYVRQSHAAEKPARSPVTQCAEAGSGIKHEVKSTRHDSPLSHAVHPQKLPHQLQLSASHGSRSVSESRVSQGREQQGPCANVRKHAWADQSSNSTSQSSSSSTLDRDSLDAALTVHNSASQSIMVPLELPSPMPESSSEGDALPCK